MQIRNVEKTIINQRRNRIIKELYKEKFTPGQIAKIVNRDRTWVWRIVKNKK